MALGAADLRSIVARSSTLFERIAGPFTAAADDGGCAVVESRLDRLRHCVARGDRTRFARYARWHAWDRRAIHRGLGAVVFDGDRLPEWAGVLQQLDERAAPAAGPPLAEESEPFEEAMAPWRNVARHRLHSSLARRGAAFGEGACCAAAVTGFERALVRQLARIAARTLYAEFGAFRSSEASDGRNGAHTFFTSLASLVGGAGRVHYDAFMARLSNGGLDRVLLDYPMLARLLAMRVLGWVETTSEFLQRLAADTPSLERVFAGGKEIGSVTSLVTDLSDPHHGGRTVSRVGFASGLQLVYKPRSLASEAAFSSLLIWLNDGRLPLPLKAPTVLDCGSYGWMEHVSFEACRDAAEVDRYYRRAGMLLCLAYVMGGSDLHQGNVIACGEHPVLVDLEVLMSAPPRPDPSNGVQHDADGSQVWDSVLRTGLLPVNRLGLRGRHHRDGGLVETDPGFKRRIPYWAHVNTDLMTLELRRPVSSPLNLPHLDGTPVTFDSHVDAVAGGFAAMSDALQRARPELTGANGALAPFRGARKRVVLRATAVYGTLLERALHPRLLEDGADWSIELEILKAPPTAHASRPRSWRTWLAEQRALTRLDVPLFESTSEGTSVAADGDELASDYLAESGYDAAISRLAELDDERTRVHLQCIRLAGRRPSAATHASSVDTTASAHGLRVGVPEAVDIARTLRAIADESAADGIQWVGIRGLNGSAQRGVQRVGWDLYGGRCGIGLLFAALESRGVLEQESSFATLLLRPLVNALLAGTPVDTGQTTHAVGALGAGGFVYALTTISKFQHSEPMLDAAARAAAAITLDEIASDVRFDLIFGSAGAALGLLALHNVRPQPWVLERAIACGRHLLRHASSDGERRGPAWHTVGGRVVDGFAHGSAGIAYALARLYRETGTTAFRDAAVTALRRGAVSADLAEDTTFHDEYAEGMRRSWCQGIAGIGLARLEVSRLTGCPDSRAGLESLLDELTPAVLSPSDQVCCGNVGSFDLLSRAANDLDDERWRAAADARAGQVVARAAQRGSYAVSAIDDAFSPGFYQGLSGIGYEFLRLTCRDLPSVLLWE